MYVIKTCITHLVLKDKNAQHWKSFSFSSQIALMSLWYSLKNPKPIEDVNSLGYFLHNLNTLILQMMVVLWFSNLQMSLANISFKSFKKLSLMICNVYNTFFCCFNNIFIPLIIIAAFSGSCTSSASLFKSSNFRFSSIIFESRNRFFIFFLDLGFVFLLSTKSFHIYKQKIGTLVPNIDLKQKYLSRLIFCKFRSKKLPHLQSFVLFHILLLKHYQ